MPQSAPGNGDSVKSYESELQASLRRAARCSHYSEKKLSRRLKQTSLS